MNITATPIRASTQDHLDVEDIIDDIVILKNGACALVIQVTAINFGLLSEEEQDAIIYSYAGLLNSLTFQVQIIVRSAIKDITDYIRLIREQEKKQQKPLLLEQLQKYRQFVESIVKDNQVLDKKFYITIPFTTLELGLGTTIGASFQKTKKLPYPKNYILERAKMNLYPKRDHLFRQFGRLGLQARQLNTQQLLELFYNFYNQDSVGQQFVPTKEYQAPLVQKEPNQLNPKPPQNPIQPIKAMPNIPSMPFPQNNKAQIPRVATNTQSPIPAPISRQKPVLNTAPSMQPPKPTPIPPAPPVEPFPNGFNYDEIS